MTSLRSLPSVDHFLQLSLMNELAATYGRPLTLRAIRTVFERIRSQTAQDSGVPVELELVRLVQSQLESWTAPSLLPVINASGVVLHTNLGRAPLSTAAVRALQVAAAEYSNLEYDLKKGQRGSRLEHAEGLLKLLLGVEAAVVVNNNAAAVLLVLTALARRRSVVIARTQLVEIGGGFRVPDVMRQSGARLVEVGATNRVHLSDYEQALEEKPALFLRAHRSNFKIIGFTSEPGLEEIAALAHRAALPLVDDLGSGALLDTARFGLAH
ncbi:MAG TPA: L-seryl-tRNA(Sec) selenium transferase, partial [Anaerolineales bacterium]